MARVILLIAVVMLTIYCVVDVALSRNQVVRGMPHWMWAFVVIIAPLLGPLLWLFLGRPQPQQPPRIPPDDNDDFLQGLR